jgi:hypothetical protein
MNSDPDSALVEPDTYDVEDGTERRRPSVVPALPVSPPSPEFPDKPALTPGDPPRERHPSTPGLPQPDPIRADPPEASSSGSEALALAEHRALQVAEREAEQGRRGIGSNSRAVRRR